MRSRIGVLKWVFLGMFAVISTGITLSQWLYVIPYKKCEATKGWWSYKYWRCYQPVMIENMPGMKKAKPPAVTAPPAGQAAESK